MPAGMTEPPIGIPPSSRSAILLQRGWLAPLVIAAAVFAVYLPNLHHAFQYDDLHSIVENPHLRSLANIDDFFWRPDMFTADPKSGMYRPLVLISYAFNYALDGYQVEGYHIFNIAVHLANALLLYGLARRCFNSIFAGLVGGLLFALHPLAGEPVNYISSRSESLSALFSLLSLRLYIHAREGAGIGICLLSALAFACALLSKSIAIVLPLVYMAHQLSRGEISIGQLKGSIKYHLPFVLLGGAYAIAVNQAIRTALVDHPVRGWWVQAATQCKVLVYYLKLLFVPWGQSVEHQMILSRELGDGTLLVSLALLGTLAYCLVLLCRRSGTLFFWTVWPGLFLVPTFFVPLNVLANEHRIYIPAMGMAVLFGRVLQVYVGRRRGLPLLALVIVFYGALSIQRSLVWSTPATLWANAIAQAPFMPRPHLWMGDVYKTQGRNQKALDSYNIALTVNPGMLSGADLLAINNNMGAAYLALGRYSDAATWYRRALSIDPNYNKARDALEGLTALTSGALMPQAEKHHKTGLKMMVASLLDQAVGEFNRALAIQQHAKIYQALGLTHERIGDTKAAIVEYQTMLRLPGISDHLAMGIRRRITTLQSVEAIND